MVRLFLLVGFVLHLTTQPSWAKTIIMYGEDLTFWHNHRLVVGVVDGVIELDGACDIVVRVEQSMGATCGGGGDVMTGRLPQHGLGVIEDQSISEGVRVIMLGERVNSQWVIPSYKRVMYMMMPHPRAGLYRIRGDDDPQLARTLAICRAISTADAAKQEELILELVQKDKRRLGYFRIYLDRRVQHLQRAAKATNTTYNRILEMSRSDALDGPPH